MAIRVVRAPGETREQAIRRALAVDAGRKRRARNRELLESRERLRHPPSTPLGETALLVFLVAMSLPAYLFVWAVSADAPGFTLGFYNYLIGALGCAWIGAFVYVGPRVVREWWADVRALIADRFRDPDTLVLFVFFLLLGPIWVLLSNWKVFQ